MEDELSLSIKTKINGVEVEMKADRGLYLKLQDDVFLINYIKSLIQEGHLDLDGGRLISIIRIDENDRETSIYADGDGNTGHVRSETCLEKGRDSKMNWTRSAILMLIHNRKKYDKQFKSTTMKNEQCWKLVVEEMKKNNINVSTSQCNDKWKYLKDKYIKKKDNMSTKSSGAASMRFDYFEELDEFLGKRHSVQPLSLASSISEINLPSSSDSNVLEGESDGVPCVKKKKVRSKEDPLMGMLKEMKEAADRRELNRLERHKETVQVKRELTNVFSAKMDSLINLFKMEN